jgi:hypothetical protein
MRQEIKKQKMQHLADLIAEGMTQSSPWSMWPESQYGGDGEWNNYGDDAPPIPVDVPPIAADVPRPADVTFDVPPITVDVTQQDFISF